MPAIASLGSGIRFIKHVGVNCIADSICYMSEMLCEALSDIKGINIYGSDNGIVSFNASGMMAEDVSRKLAEKGICVRGGLHCAPLAHKSIGTYDIGCVRASISYFNTEREIKSFVNAVTKIINCRRA